MQWRSLLPFRKNGIVTYKTGKKDANGVEETVTYEETTGDQLVKFGVDAGIGSGLTVGGTALYNHLKARAAEAAPAAVRGATGSGSSAVGFTGF